MTAELQFNPFQLENLRSTLKSTCDILSQDNGLRVLPNWLLDMHPIEVLETPLVICGFDPVLSPIFLYLLHEQQFNLAIYADDLRAGESIDHQKYLSLFDLSQQAHLKKHIFINFCAHHRGQYQSFQHFAEVMKLRMINIHQLDFYFRKVAYRDLKTTIDPNYYVTDVLQHLDDYLSLADLLDDDRSKGNLYKVLLGRLTINLQHFWDIYSDVNTMYFPTFFNYTRSEILVDGGAFDGSDALRFLRQRHYYFNRIYLYEICDSNIDMIRTNLSELNGLNLHKKLILREKGLWHKEDILSYTGENLYALLDDKIAVSRKHAPGKPVQVTNIDTDIEKASLIKLEIEGAELNALQGGQGLIQTQKPKLSVSLYHQSRDIWNILTYLNDLELGYKFRLRHHWGSEIRTILYCAKEFVDF